MGLLWLKNLLTFNVMKLMYCSSEKVSFVTICISLYQGQHHTITTTTTTVVILTTTRGYTLWATLRSEKDSSVGNVYSCSHSSSGRSRQRPLLGNCEAWMCVSMKPGIKNWLWRNCIKLHTHTHTHTQTHTHTYQQWIRNDKLTKVT